MNKLIETLNRLAYIELYPDCWILHHCPKGCSKGGISGKYFQTTCEHCKSVLIIDKILLKYPKKD